MLKTSELEGAALDEYVAKALGLTTQTRYANTGRPIYGAPDFIDCPSEDPTFGDPFTPSTRWDHGGPIIEMETIRLEPSTWDSGGGVQWVAGPKRPQADMRYPHGVQYGPTPLIAAMRAFVRSVFGDEVKEPSDEAPGAK